MEAEFDTNAVRLNASISSNATRLQGVFRAGMPGKDGKDGVSPTVSVADETGGHRITITDADGTTSFFVPDGVDGKNGTNGTNGVSPTVQVSTISGGHRVTITDASGTKSFDVTNGKDGSGTGDMLAATYDPAGGARQVAFKNDLDTHTGNATIHITAEERTAWNGKQDKLTGTAGQVVGFDESGSAVAQDAPSGGSSAAMFTATLLASGWTDDGSYKSQTISAAGLKEAYAVSPDIDCVLSGTDAASDAAIIEAWALVSICATGADSLTAMCVGSAPDVNIPVVIRTFE